MPRLTATERMMLLLVSDLVWGRLAPSHLSLELAIPFASWILTMEPRYLASLLQGRSAGDGASLC